VFESNGVVGRLAAAIVDRDPISWRDVPSATATPVEQEVLVQLRTLAWLQDGARDAGRADAGRPLVVRPSVWFWFIVVAYAQIVIGLVAAAASGRPANALLGYQIALTACFGAAALVLHWGGARHDPRASRLGDFYLLAAASFAQALLSVHGPSRFASFALAFHPEALLAFALWRFVDDFPRATRFDAFDRWSRRFIVVSGAVGALLFVDNILVASFPFSARVWMRLFRRSFEPGAVSLPFWLITQSLLVPALATAVWRTHLCEADERRRSYWFLWGIGLGVLPLSAVAILRAVSPAFRALMATSSTPRGAIDALVIVSMLSIPFSTAYAILVRNVLTIRVVLHHAVRHALARYTLLLGMTVPILVPLRQVYLHRERRVEDVLADPWARIALAIMLGAVVLLAFRGWALALVDRWFLGKSFDSNEVVQAMTEAIGRARTAREIAGELAHSVETGLGVFPVAVLLPHGDRRWRSVHGSAPPLPPETALLALLHDSPSVVFPRESRLFGLLPADDREWLFRGAFEALIRIPIGSSTEAGIAAIGSRANDAPLSTGDLAVLNTIATTAGIALSRLARTEGDADDDGFGATECERCGALRREASCACERPFRPALLPLTLAGKFEVIRRLGRGGMGVVYLGRDTRLDRAVALKTLPQVSWASATALLAEAKTMAQVEHAHLAMVYGVEVWRDTPVLVVEFLAEGTLSDRLMRGPIPRVESLRIGAEVADALAELHRAGILHRDIKPSNVGFTRSGTTKLLDFGIARLMEQAEIGTRAPASMSSERFTTAIAGTPLYLSPEVLRGERPTPVADLWSTSVMVLEALVGRYPFGGETPGDVVRRTQRAAPDWRACRSELSPSLITLFERLLHPNPGNRPSSAAVLGIDLRRAANESST
jgi:hypothetical protein